MDIDEDDDFYSPEEPAAATNEKSGAGAGGSAGVASAGTGNDTSKNGLDDELEEGEEEDEGAEMDEDEDDDSDIDIITERKDGSKPVPPPQTRYNDIRNIPQRTASGDGSSARQVASHGARKEETKTVPIYPTAVPTADKAAAAASSSKLDINGNPVHAPTGKPITQVNIDEDLPDNEKPWRKPGTDITDYFNYGFDEFTWALYAAKQESLRAEYNQDIIAANNKKMLEDFNMMMMGGMPGMPGGAPPSGPSASATGGSGAAGVSGAVTGMDGMTPEMQAMMQQMMASGIDPSQMDPASMASMFAGMQGQGAGQPQGGYGQNFGQGQYGYDGMGGGSGGGGRGRGGRGGRRW